MVGSISKSKNKTKQRTKVSCCGNSLKLAVSFEFKNRVSRTRLNETCLNPPLHNPAKTILQVLASSCTYHARSTRTCKILQDLTKCKIKETKTCRFLACARFDTYYLAR